MNIFNQVSSILCELSGSDIICLHYRLVEDLSLDSLQMVTLLMMLEEEFKIVLEESDMNPFDLITVQNVMDLAEKYVGGKEQ